MPPNPAFSVICTFVALRPGADGPGRSGGWQIPRRLLPGGRALSHGRALAQEPGGARPAAVEGSPDDGGPGVSLVRYPATVMCNLYLMTTNQQAIRDLARLMRDMTGNLPALPGIFPDQPAPIVRTGVDGVRELARARWGMPSPVFALAGRKVDRGVTNVRNTDSPHWRRWLTPASRCLVPFTSFSESVRRVNGKFEPAWFALDPSRPLAFFAGIWTDGPAPGGWQRVK